MYEKFSVLISVYKNENPKYLERAIESIYFEQILKPNEIILVEDGPLTNKLYEVIETLKKKLKNILKIVKLEKNSGLGKALEIGITQCSNELIARMDSDDISNKKRFKKQIECFKKNKNLCIVGTNISEFIGDEKNIVSKRSVPEKDLEIRKYLKKRCPFNHVSVMLKKSAVIAAGSYKEMFWNEDYYLWIRMYSSEQKFYNIQEELVNVRIGKEMYRRRGGFKYFKSEFKLQNYMLEKNIIGRNQYLINIFLRFTIQVLLPSQVRGYIFKKFARY